MTQPVMGALSLEEQYALLPCLMVFSLTLRHLGITPEDVEDAAQTIIYYNWRTGRQLNRPLLFRAVQQGCYRIVQSNTAIKRGGKKKRSLEALLGSFETTTGAAQREVLSGLVDRNNVEQSVLDRALIREVASRSWGRTLLKGELGLLKPGTASARRSENKEELSRLWQEWSCA